MLRTVVDAHECEELSDRIENLEYKLSNMENLEQRVSNLEQNIYSLQCSLDNIPNTISCKLDSLRWELRSEIDRAKSCVENLKSDIRLGHRLY
jgi:predicted  nucleic acid-binding Zn-ribbon protein